MNLFFALQKSSVDKVFLCTKLYYPEYKNNCVIMYRCNEKTELMAVRLDV